MPELWLIYYIPNVNIKMNCFALVLILVNLNFTQADWIPVTVDKSLTVRLPAGAKMMDTLQQKIYHGSTDIGTVAVATSQSNVSHLPISHKELIEHYDDFIIGYLRSFESPKDAVKSLIKLDGLTSMNVEFWCYVSNTKTYFNIAFSIVGDNAYVFQSISNIQRDAKINFDNLAKGITFTQ